MGVEGGIAKVGLAAVAGEVAAVLVIPSATLSLEVLALVVVEPVSLGAEIRLAHKCTQILQQFELMLCFLGLRLDQPLSDKQKYKECLQEMRHYLSLRKAEISQSDYVITVTNEAFAFALPKNPLYLHTNFYNMPLFNSNDYDFLDTCYECLMILQEAFPLNVRIELVSDSESQELQAFQDRKEEELNRRINSNLRTLTESSNDLAAQDVESIIFLIQHHYTRKNKTVALKLLTSKVTPANAADLPEEFLEVVLRLQEQSDLRKVAGELVGRIRSIQGEFQREKENLMKASNLSSENKYGEGLKLQPLIFQLRESYNLERVCSLLAHTLNLEQEKDYYCKLQSAITTVTTKFLGNEFQETGRFGSEFYELLKRFWSKRGKKWDESIRISLQNKIRSLNLNNRTNNNRSRVITSRNDS